MTGSSSRFGRFLKSSVNALLTPAEDPRTAYADPTQQQRAMLEQLRIASQRLAATRSRLEFQRVAVGEKVQLLEDQARQALAADREDLARLALQRQRIGQAEIEYLDRQIDGLQREEAQLATIEQRLSARIEALRAREQMAAARHTAARAQVAVGEALSGVGAVSGDSEIVERIERDAEELEARADAIEELINTGVLGTRQEL
jgi:phage shock protein A